MQKLSQRQRENRIKIRKRVFSNLQEAIDLLKTTATAKFVETVELHVNLNIKPKQSNQQLRTTIVLPHGIGNPNKIAVLTTEDNNHEVKKAGADIVGSDDLINQIRQNNINFDLLITTPNMMPKLARLGRILGPKGLMPSPRAGTVSTMLTKTVLEFKKGKFEYKVDKTGSIHVSFGKSNFTNIQLLDNLKVLYKSIEQNRPLEIRGKYFKSLFLCTTMGPSIQIDVKAFN